MYVIINNINNTIMYIIQYRCYVCTLKLDKARLYKQPPCTLLEEEDSLSLIYTVYLNNNTIEHYYTRCTLYIKYYI